MPGSESPQGVADRLSSGSSSRADGPPSADDSRSDSTLTADSPKSQVVRDEKNLKRRRRGRCPAGRNATGPSMPNFSKSTAPATAKSSSTSGVVLSSDK